MRLKTLLALCLAAGVVLTANAWPDNMTVITLAWDDPVAATEGVVGYKVYYGNTSRGYTAFSAANMTGRITLTGLPRGTQIYFAVTAVNADGLESDYSAEISYRFDNLPTAPVSFRIISASKDR